MPNDQADTARKQLSSETSARDSKEPKDMQAPADNMQLADGSPQLDVPESTHADEQSQLLVQLSEMNAQQMEITNQQAQVIEQLEREKMELERKNRELREENQNVHKTNTHLTNELNTARQRTQQFDRNVAQINELQNQVSLYEARLGKETNVRWGDADPNNAAQLRADLDTLCSKLTAFINMKRGAEIKHDMMNKLLQQYKCREPYTTVMMNAALQRWILELIFNDMVQYLKGGMKALGGTPQGLADLECDLHHDALVVQGELEKISKNRIGTDEMSKIASVKIRQQVCAVLSTRGFACEGQHQFIVHVVQHVTSELDKFRVLVDEQKKAALPTTLTDLVRRILTTFPLRLKAQEPVAMHRFYEAGAPYHPVLMQSAMSDESETELEVEICSFPVVATNPSLKASGDPGVYRAAQVVTRPRGQVLHNQAHPQHQAQHQAQLQAQHQAQLQAHNHAHLHNQGNR